MLLEGNFFSADRVVYRFKVTLQGQASEMSPRDIVSFSVAAPNPVAAARLLFHRDFLFFFTEGGLSRVEALKWVKRAFRRRVFPLLDAFAALLPVAMA